MMTHALLLVLAAAFNLARTQAANASICSSAAFTAITGTRLGNSPIYMRALVQGDAVCIEYQLNTKVAPDATWFAVGPAAAAQMVNTPHSNVMMFFKSTGKPTAYTLGGYVSDEVTEASDQSTFVVGATNTTSMSFSFQRTLAAASTADVALSATSPSTFIWAYGTTFPISGHKSGTNGAATFNLGAAASSTVGSSDSSQCDDKNCPAIVGGVAFALMAVCGLLLMLAFKHSPVGTLLLQRTVAPPPVKQTTNALVPLPHTMFWQTLADLHLGEVLVVLIFVAALIVLIALLDNARNYVVSGQVSLLTLMFLILPVARLPLWAVLFGSSFERMVKFHRWLGLVLIVALIVHIIQASKVVGVTHKDKYGKVTPLYGFIAFLCFAVMLVLSNEYVRRMFFEVFYFSHRVLSIVGFVFAILHSPKLIGLALCVPLGLYALGLIYHWSSAITGVYKVAASVHSSSNTTTLVLEATPKTGKMAMNLHPGSYFLVRLPAVSAIQWHPFSAIVTPDGKSLGFCVKAMGNAGSFTRTLLAKASSTESDLTANLCGPFGKLSLELDQYDAVVLVAGGVGMTPMIHLINHARLFPHNGMDKTCKALDWYVLWSVREPHDLLMMDDFFPTQAQLDFATRGAMPDAGVPIVGTNAVPPVKLNWMFHVTNAMTDGVVTRANGETLSYRGGKAILDEVINTSRFNNRKVTVVACGPPTMTVEAQSLARTCGFDFHKEVFQW